MPIRLKLLLACLCMALITSGVGLLALRSERQLGALAMRMYDEAFMSVNYVRAAETKFAVLRGEAAARPAPPPRSERERLLAAARGEAPVPAAVPLSVADILDDLDVAAERAMTSEGRRATAELRQRVARLPDAPDTLTQLEALGRAFDAVVEATAADGFTFREQVEALVASTARSSSIAIAAAVLAALGVTLVLGRAIVPPIRQAARVAAEVAAGRFDTPVTLPRRVGRSETAALLHGLAAMQASIAADRARIAEMGEERDAARARADAEMAKALEGMARRVEAEAEEALGGIGGSMDGIIAEVDRLAEVARGVAGNAASVAAASGEALSGTQTVAAATEELAASTGEISRMVGRAAAVAQRGVERSDAGSATIRGLSEAVGRVGAVSRLIADIAGRTNLLALNATIEAAKAGEAGKGFAVVASEVKQLAAQTARATEDIAAQIGEIGAATERAVATVGEIAGTIADIDEASSAIAAAVEQQGIATREIARAVAEASQAVSHVSGRIAEVSGATSETGTLADGVRGGAGEARGAVIRLREVLVRVVRTATPEVDRRLHPRLATPGLGATLRIGARALPVLLADLSAGGARLAPLGRGAATPTAGERGSLEIAGLAAPLACEVLVAPGGGGPRLRFLAPDDGRADLAGLVAAEGGQAAA
jgi:methyl-accepting chemotaxis protein